MTTINHQGFNQRFGHPKRPKIDWATLSPDEKRRLRARRMENLADGNYNHGVPPYGYRFKRDKYGFRQLIPDPKVQAIVCDAYTMVLYAEMNSYRELAIYLTSKLGKKFYPATAKKLFCDMRNIGYYVLPPELGGKHIKATNFEQTLVPEKLFEQAVRRTLQECW